MEENVEKPKMSEFGAKAELSLKRAVKNAIERHAKLGQKVVVWKNGKTMIVDATSLLNKGKR